MEEENKTNQPPETEPKPEEAQESKVVEKETEQKREVGEKWTDSDGKEWEQKEGYKTNVSAMDDVRAFLNKLNTLSLVSVIVTVMVSALPESSDTKIDLITPVVAEGTVYKVVTLVVVKSTFLFTNELAKEVCLRF